MLRCFQRMYERPWRLWIDSGGTFTDCVALDPSGRVHRAKVVSSALPGGDEAPTVAARMVTSTPLGQALPPLEVRLATTRGTNALLERQGVATALFVTKGFGDLLEIGNQQRPELFTLAVAKRRVFHTAVVEVDERLDADGTVLRDLDLDSLEIAARELVGSGTRAAAVALLHSYRNPSHEQAVAQHLICLGFDHVSLSSTLSARIRILQRAETAIIDAYLSEAISSYVERVATQLGARSLHLMTSAAGLVQQKGFHPKDSLLSGPAAGALGAVAAAHAADAAGLSQVLAFDMGGTSTDVTRYDGEFEIRRETPVGDALLLSPSLAVETVAAGGGSICRFDGRRLTVGPESAGATPGPACYGFGGPLTLTDVNLLLGRLDPTRFPFPLQLGPARAQAEALYVEVAELTAEMSGGTRGAHGLEDLLSGLLQIANEKMAVAIRRSAVRRGFRPSDHWLVAFGGAGPQHACAVAEILEINQILIPSDGALLSAFGLGEARIERILERQILAPVEEVEPRVTELLSELVALGEVELAGEGVARSAVEIRRQRALVRFSGQESTLEVKVPAIDGIRAAFAKEYRRVFGYQPEHRPIELESLRVVMAGGVSSRGVTLQAGKNRGEKEFSTRRQRLYAGGVWNEVAAFERDRLTEHVEVVGPAVVVEDHSLTVVETGWRARVDTSGALLVERNCQ